MLGLMIDMGPKFYSVPYDNYDLNAPFLPR